NVSCVFTEVVSIFFDFMSDNSVLNLMDRCQVEKGWEEKSYSSIFKYFYSLSSRCKCNDCWSTQVLSTLITKFFEQYIGNRIPFLFKWAIGIKQSGRRSWMIAISCI